MANDLKMSKNEIERFLQIGRVLRMATLNKDGSPHIAPIWYLYEKSNIYIETSPDSIKVQNVRRDPRVAVCIDIGQNYYDIKNVVLKCRAEIVSDKQLRRSVKEKIMVKYLGSIDHRVAKEILSYEGCVVELKLDGKIISQDYTKLE